MNCDQKASLSGLCWRPCGLGLGERGRRKSLLATAEYDSLFDLSLFAVALFDKA